MLDTLFDSICRVGVFVMCAQTIVHFKPKEVYEKYMRYLVSIMVLIQLFLPLGGFVLGGGSKEISRALEQFQAQLQASMEQAEENAAKAEEKLESMTLEEVRKQLEQQEENTGEKTQEGSGEDAQVQAETQDKEIEIEVIEPIVVGD